MGIFDEIIINTKCPYCGLEKDFGFQTHSLGEMYKRYHVGDQVLTEGLEIYEGIIKNCIDSCPNCKKTIYTDVVIKEGKIEGIKKLRSE